MLSCNCDFLNFRLYYYNNIVFIIIIITIIVIIRWRYLKCIWVRHLGSKQKSQSGELKQI